MEWGKWELKWLLGGETKWREQPLNKPIPNLEIQDRHPGEGQDRETYGLRDCEGFGMKKLVMYKSFVSNKFLLTASFLRSFRKTKWKI